MSDNHDIRIVVHVKNAVMLRAMEEEGFKTASALARAAGVNQTVIGEYLGLKRAPFRKNGTISPNIQRLSQTLRRLPEDLFPAAFLYRALKKNRAERDVAFEDVAAMLGHDRLALSCDPERHAIVQEAVAGLDAALAKLLPRYRQALTMRYGLDGGKEHQLGEIARALGVTTERVRQMLLMAERKLRDPSIGLKKHTLTAIDECA